MFALCGLVLCGCDNTRLYDGSIREPVGRWPDDVQTCGVVTNVILPLNIVVTQDQLPFLPMGRAGCGYSPEAKTAPILDEAYLGIGAPMGVDSDGGGSYLNYYNFKLARNEDFFTEKLDPINGKTNQMYNPTWSYYAPATVQYPKTWTFNSPIFDRKETINGLVWRHFMFWEYDSLMDDRDAPPLSVASKDSVWRFWSIKPEPVVPVPYPDSLIFVGEVYEHVIDKDHKMLVYAGYDRPVTQDAHWLATRRALLKKLVDAVTITPLTPERLERIRRKNAVHALNSVK